MTEIVRIISARTGEYVGEGTNHEDQSFVGLLKIFPVVKDHGVSISFTATGLDGKLFHQEQSLIAPSISEKLCLWNLNTNIPGLVEHEFRRAENLVGADHSFVFGFGTPTATSSFREEIAIDLWQNGDISYRYSWGMPGGSFEARSAVRMQVKKPTRNLFDLPKNLPAPQDDGACDHLIGQTLPDMALQATNGHMVNLKSVTEGLTVFFFYPRTGRPDEPAPADWDDIPGARGCTPQSCGFRDNFGEFKALNVQVFGVSSQTTDYQKEFKARTNRSS